MHGGDTQIMIEGYDLWLKLCIVKKEVKQNGNISMFAVDCHLRGYDYYSPMLLVTPVLDKSNCLVLEKPGKNCFQ